jgi:hypothetical protein
MTYQMNKSRSQGTTIVLTVKVQVPRYLNDLNMRETLFLLKCKVFLLQVNARSTRFLVLVQNITGQ